MSDSVRVSLKKLGLKNQGLAKALLKDENITFITKNRNTTAPWVLEDSEGEESVVLSNAELKKILKSFQKLQEEKIKLVLEKAILQQMPIDFEDVWTVAMREIEKKKTSVETEAKLLDIGGIVKSIKKSHPNLFFDLGELMRGSVDF